MEFIGNIPALVRALLDYATAHQGTLPEALSQHLDAALNEVSRVRTIVDAGEALFAHRADLDAEGLTLCAQLIGFAAQDGWHGLGVDARGARIVQAIRRDLGEESVIAPWPEPATDPAPLAAFAPAAVVEFHPPVEEGTE